MYLVKLRGHGPCDAEVIAASAVDVAAAAVVPVPVVAVAVAVDVVDDVVDVAVALGSQGIIGFCLDDRQGLEDSKVVDRKIRDP